MGFKQYQEEIVLTSTCVVCLLTHTRRVTHSREGEGEKENLMKSGERKKKGGGTEIHQQRCVLRGRE